MYFPFWLEIHQIYGTCECYLYCTLHLCSPTKNFCLYRCYIFFSLYYCWCCCSVQWIPNIVRIKKMKYTKTKMAMFLFALPLTASERWHGTRCRYMESMEYGSMKMLMFVWHIQNVKTKFNWIFNSILIFLPSTEIEIWCARKRQRDIRWI